jgi:hypothetical protein
MGVVTTSAKLTTKQETVLRWLAERPLALPTASVVWTKELMFNNKPLSRSILVALAAKQLVEERYVAFTNTTYWMITPAGCAAVADPMPKES